MCASYIVVAELVGEDIANIGRLSKGTVKFTWEGFDNKKIVGLKGRGVFFLQCRECNEVISF